MHSAIGVWLTIGFVGGGAALTVAQEHRTGAVTNGGTVLIAMEQSEFKRAVVERVRDGLVRKGVAVKVGDLRQLGGEAAGKYDAVVILNTVWAWRLKGEVRAFLKAASADLKKKVILINTANDESWKTKEAGVDAITSASRKNNVDRVAAWLQERLEAKLAPAKAAGSASADAPQRPPADQR